MYNTDGLLGKDIAILQYPKDKFGYSYGKIVELDELAKNEFSHSAETSKGSSGSPIFLKDTTIVIGVHKQKDIGGGDNSCGYGEFISPIFRYLKGESITIGQGVELNQMTIIHRIDFGDDGIYLFGEKFVENNKNNCYLLIDGKEKLIMWLFGT